MRDDGDVLLGPAAYLVQEGVGALREGVMEHAASNEPHMREGMRMLKERHPCVKQARVLGMFGYRARTCAVLGTRALLSFKPGG